MPVKRGSGRFAKPTWNQAAKVIRKFGSEAEFAKAVGVSRITAYRYQYAHPYGTDGLIPTRKVEDVKIAARIYGIVLSAADWEPERIRYEEAAP